MLEKNNIELYASILDPKNEVSNSIDISPILWPFFQVKDRKPTILINESIENIYDEVNRLALQIKNKECPEKFADYQILSINLNSFINDPIRRNAADKSLIDYFKEQSKTILFINDFDIIFNNALELITCINTLNLADYIIIGAMSRDKYNNTPLHKIQNLNCLLLFF